MTEFSLENKSEQIYHSKTKEYFKEVLSSYQHENYRSAVVMLWSVVICDIVYKLQEFIDLYDDEQAKKILDQCSKEQTKDEKSSKWETTLIEMLSKETCLLEANEKENLFYLQKQRHLSAHPVLRESGDLYVPNKDTARALIRNTLEGILMKPSFYIMTRRQMFDKFSDDIANLKEHFPPSIFYWSSQEYENFKKILETKYFSYFSLEVEMHVFRTLWQFLFQKDDKDNYKDNRGMNFMTLRLINYRHKKQVTEEILKDKLYYSKIASEDNHLLSLVLHLFLFSENYQHLEDDTKIKIKKFIETNKIAKKFGWFIKDSLEAHYNDLMVWIEKDDTFEVRPFEWNYLKKLCDSEEWQIMFTKLLAFYYGNSKNYDAADKRFDIAIKPYIDLFKKDSLVFLLDKIENNDQTYNRKAAKENHLKIKNQIDKIDLKDFCYENYPNFQANIKAENETRIDEKTDLDVF